MSDFKQHQGAVLYAKLLAPMVDFYVNAIGFSMIKEDVDFAVLEANGFQLVILQAPQHIAEAITITSPPEPREETPVKLVFFAGINTVRSRAEQYGGTMKLPAQEWKFQKMTVCDGIDPEGNIFQIRE